MTTSGQFITVLQAEQRLGNVSSETEQHLKHEFRRPGRDASSPTLAAAVEAANKGTIPAYAPVARITYKLPARNLDQKEINEELESISRIIQKAPYDLENRDTLAVGYEGFSTVSDLTLTNEQIRKFHAGEFAIYVFAGSAASPSLSRIIRFRQTVTGTGPGVS